jgi:hypothetical protein
VTWEAPLSNVLDFTTVPFHIFKAVCDRSVHWDDFDAAWKDILTPNNSYSDILQWANNTRAQSMMRRVFLEQRYGRSPHMKDILEKHSFADALYLPSRDEVISAFQMKDWGRHPEGEDVRKNELLKGLKSEHDSVEHWSLEDIMESAGCCVYGRNEFNYFCEEFQHYEFLTSTYVDALANHIRAKAKSSPPKGGKEFILLEIGAGSGRLAAHLEERLGSDNILVVATDSAEWNLQQHFRVEHYNHKEALKLFKPDMVLASWMPVGVDWTKDIRRAGVDEYILVGEADGGCCGHPWYTWGVVHGRTGKKGAIAPFVADGYKKLPLGDISKLQLQRYDSKQYNQNSQTVSFQFQT